MTVGAAVGARPRVVAVGEAMLELSCSEPSGAWRMACGGDSYNTAVHLARAGLRVGFLTALGADPFSDELRRDWTAEGLDASLVLTDDERLPGLYAIRTDDVGEREFFYWRERSAARRLFQLEGVDAALDLAVGADLLYLTGITLSLYDAAGRRRLAELARQVRARGGEVAFDPNYRPRGWPSVEAARQAIESVRPHVSVALPTFDDERSLHGDVSPLATVARWRAAGARRVAVKLGAEGAIVWTADGVRRVAARKVGPVDTTGAGDAFNAGFLAAILEGRDDVAATRDGNALAAEVVGHRGAVALRPGRA